MDMIFVQKDFMDLPFGLTGFNSVFQISWISFRKIMHKISWIFVQKKNHA